MSRKTRREGPVKKDQREAALALVRAGGREGGKLRWKDVSPEQRREVARKAARARWAKAKKEARARC